MNSVNVYNILLLLLLLWLLVHSRHLPELCFYIRWINAQSKRHFIGTICKWYNCDLLWWRVKRHNCFQCPYGFWFGYSLLYCVTYAVCISFGPSNTQICPNGHWCTFRTSQNCISASDLWMQTADCQRLFYSFNVEFQLYGFLCFCFVFHSELKSYWLVNIEFKLHREVFQIPSKQSIPIFTKWNMNAINTLRREAIESPNQNASNVLQFAVRDEMWHEIVYAK